MTFYGFSPGDLLQVLGHVSCSQWNGGWDTDQGQGTRGRLIWSEETQRHVKNTTISEMVDLYVSVSSQNVYLIYSIFFSFVKLLMCSDSLMFFHSRQSFHERISLPSLSSAELSEEPVFTGRVRPASRDLSSRSGCSDERPLVGQTEKNKSLLRCSTQCEITTNINAMVSPILMSQ